MVSCLVSIDFTLIIFLLGNVQEYKYLGILMRASGRFTNVIQYLSNKALKVVFMIRRQFQTESLNPSLLLKLFDICVKPVLLYRSELWSIFNLNVSKNSTNASMFTLEKRYEEFLPENIHTKFCKFILGVNKYTSNLASKAELERYPVIISVLLQSIKYWLYLNDNPFEKYNRFSYLSLIHLYGNIASTFNHHICCVLKYFGFNHVWGNKSTMSVPKLMHALKKVIFSKYEQFFFESIKGAFHTENATNKLRTYCKFKTTYNFKNYLAVKVD